MKKNCEVDAEVPKLSDLLCFALYSTHHAMHRINKGLLDDLKLTYPQFLVLVVLWEKDNQLVNDIGKALYLESNTLTPLLKRLETMGHIKRTRDAQDERKVRVTLTASGKKLKQATTCFSDVILDVSGLTPDSLEELTKSIVGLREQLVANAG